MLRHYLFALVPAAALFLACGDDDDAATTPPGDDAGSASSSGSSGTSSSSSSSSSSSGGTDCEKRAAAVCAFGKRCLPGFLEETTCEGAANLRCEHERKLAGYATAPLPQSCLDAYNGAACTGAQTPPAIDTDECTAKGTLDNGKACEVDGQCQSGSCFKKNGGVCGVCAAFAAEGADCNNAECAPGLHCLGTKVAGERTCRKYDALGAECTIGSCAYPNRCVGGTCKAPLPDGADCNHPAGDENPCEKSCLQAGNTCGPSPSVFVKAGEKCEGVALLCPAGTSCHGPKDDRKCVLDARAGETCSDTDGPECTAGYTCVSGKCEERPLDSCK